MLFRALLLSLLIHAIFLLAAPAGRVLPPSGQGRSGELRAVLQNQEGGRKRVVTTSVPAEPAASVLRRRAPSPATFPVERLPAGKTTDRADAPPAVRAATDEGAVSADGLREYRLAIARVARRFKRYPVQVREADVLISIRLDVVAGEPAVELASSSGYPELDAEALALVSMAVRSAVVPESLRGRSVVLSLPVRYSPPDE